MSKPTGRMFAKALEEAGVVTDLNTVERIVIDIDATLARVYVQRIGDDKLLDALAGQLGLMLAEAAAPEPVVHACPVDGEQATPCCRQVPFDLPRTDRITRDHKLVTCTDTPKHAAGCDLMLGHKVPGECQPSAEGGGA